MTKQKIIKDTECFCASKCCEKKKFYED